MAGLSHVPAAEENQHVIEHSKLTALASGVAHRKPLRPPSHHLQLCYTSQHTKSSKSEGEDRHEFSPQDILTQ